MSTPNDNGPIISATARIEVGIDSTQDFNQGDLVKYVTGTKLHEIADDTTDGRLLAGVVEDSNPSASVGQRSDRLTIVRGGIFRFKAKNGETYEHGSQLVIDAGDPQTVRLYVAGGGGDSALDIIGTAFLPLGGTVVAGTATYIEVQLTINYPAVITPVSF